MQVGDFQHTRAAGIHEKHEKSVTQWLHFMMLFMLCHRKIICCLVKSQSTNGLAYIVPCTDLGRECTASRVQLLKHAEALAEKHKLTLSVIPAGIS